MICPKCGSKDRLLSGPPTVGFDQKGNVCVITFAGCNDCDLVGELKGECKLEWVWNDRESKEKVGEKDSEVS